MAVYERSAGRTEPRGAGIVMQPEVADLLARLERSVPSVCVQLVERQQLHRHAPPTRHHAPQWMSAWDTLYEAIRTPLSDVCVRLDSRLTELAVEDGEVTARFGDGYATTADVLVGADGIGSATRRLVTGRDDLRYSGYVAFRGLEPEGSLPEDLRDLLAERFTSFAVPGMQMLCYLVPGADGRRGEGERRVNWVWYVNAAEARLPELLTGRSGNSYEFFLPPGELTAASEASVVALAEETLPAPFAALLKQSAVFMQPVFDLPPIGMVADRIVLLGDAAGTVRPHTASGTSKAFGDAEDLARALHGWRRSEPLPDLQGWEAHRLAHLRAVADAGVRLAAHSALGPATKPFL
ncbi:FAD binding domain-containing protein [Mycolicibacterium sediminis]|uniref:2-polyprenyl-6-methoxyphenol hydroxylase n=1 Tax=Mycolicibacterium sediminis TaxID=1286180 RepID=A0A7I7QZF5_9MYCO|nr:2-polyprenyl-6-methoxyphenol hydroxylase [Mycolicibacterium sediminis]